jgi:2-polyprenyl-6-methoxyphenol hydroxylase-like FAD-dependent oxidoreductase
MEETCDVFVLGGGPAGSTAAGLLAERGWKTVVVDKERHPRFHIGESMLPMSTPLFERLGVHEQVGKIGMVKYGAEFVSPQMKQTVTFDFSLAWNADYPSTYQVRRSQLDEILFRNSARMGAQTVEECRITDVQFPPDGDVRVAGEMADGTKRSWQARFFIDASGRDTFLSRRFDMKRRNHDHATAAMFGHFVDAKRLPGKEEGNISIFWFEHGWFWFIPLLDGQTSVGAVCNADYMKTRKGDTRQFFFDTIASCAGAAAWQRHCHRQLLLLLGSHVRGPVHPGRGCLGVRRSGILLGRATRHEQRLPRRRRGRYLAARSGQGTRGAASLREGRAQRRAQLLLVHLPHDHAGHRESVHAPKRQVAHAGRRDLAARRRLVPRHADQPQPAGLQGRLLPLGPVQSPARAGGLASPAALGQGRRARRGLMLSMTTLLV